MKCGPAEQRNQHPAVRKKQCPACGERFDCHAGGCWCDTVSLTEQTRDQLRQYADCLCPKCLRQYAQ